MSFEEQRDFAEQVADLNRYGQALNQCASVDEVVSLSLEAISLLLELSEVTVYEVRDDRLRVRGSTAVDTAEGAEPSEEAIEAFETGETVSASASGSSDRRACLAVPGGVVLQSLLTSTLADVQAQYEALSVEYDPEALDYQVYAGDLLDSVFSNIVSNAAVHNDGEVTVRIYTEEPAPDRVVVGVADDGSGVAPEVRDELFEMGAKGPDSEGTGFGLGFVRALTESYGGSVDVHESPAGGADFRVTLQRD